MGNRIDDMVAETKAACPPYAQYVAPDLVAGPRLPDNPDKRELATGRRAKMKAKRPQHRPIQVWALDRIRFICNADRRRPVPTLGAR